MCSRNHKKKSRAAAVLLIAVFSMLQLTLWVPSFVLALHEDGIATSCQHDHALCGCSPGRIAAGTCCCALASLSPCCQKDYIESALKEKTAHETVLTSLPCGGSEDPLVTAGSEAYLLPSMKISASPLSTTIYPLLAATSQLDRNIHPPIPPPKA
jgi:hypothetical protein